MFASCLHDPRNPINVYSGNCIRTFAVVGCQIFVVALLQGFSNYVQAVDFVCTDDLWWKSALVFAFPITFALTLTLAMLHLPTGYALTQWTFFIAIMTVLLSLLNAAVSVNPVLSGCFCQ